mmetsp:Transcript_82821/g.198764  ORF Transcript_82821/g.198764 Transcript_82821/m.198764 type:complete len:95 (+) Transcript_82821:451-735(+)
MAGASTACALVCSGEPDLGAGSWRADKGEGEMRTPSKREIGDALLIVPPRSPSRFGKGEAGLNSRLWLGWVLALLDMWLGGGVQVPTSTHGRFP